MRTLLGWLLMVATTAGAMGQEIIGFVYDAETGAPLPYANVLLKESGQGALTDENGFYRIARVRPGTYTLQVSFLGYDPYQKKVELAVGRKVRHSVYLNPTALKLEEVVVEDQALRERREETAISKLSVKKEEILELPSVGGEPDLVQYLTLLPGVVGKSGPGGQIYIRGGTPIQNRVLLDGMTIYNPFHSVGLFSVFDADIIQRVDLYSAAFGPQYGERVSAIVDIRAREGNRKRWTGKIGVGPIVNKLTVEGPLRRWDPGKPSITLLANVRGSYLSRTAQWFYPHMAHQLPFDFFDAYGKLAWSLPQGTRAALFGFRHDDRATLEGVLDHRWVASGGGFNFLLLPPGSSSTMEGIITYSDYRIEQQEGDRPPRTSSIGGFESRIMLHNYLGKTRSTVGFEMTGYATALRINSPLGLPITYEEFTTNLGLFFRYYRQWKALILDGGLRFQYYGSVQESRLEPRIQFKWRVTEGFRFKGGVGRYSQNLLNGRSDRDVVNLFYSIIASPDLLPPQFRGRPRTSRLELGRHAVLGTEWDVRPGITLDVEAYVKAFDQLVNFNRSKLYDFSPEFADQPDYLKYDFILESGVARGVDVALRWRRDEWNGILNYSWAENHRYSDRLTYPPHWDRRHTVNAMISRKWGKRWQVSARWVYGSGFPFTQTAGFYEKLPPDAIDPYGDIYEANGDLGILYGPYNGARLPDEHRLDLSLTYSKQLRPHAELRVVASVVNAYNRPNIFYFDRFRFRRVDQLPILPALSATLSF